MLNVSSLFFIMPSLKGMDGALKTLVCVSVWVHMTENLPKIVEDDLWNSRQHQNAR